MSGRASGVNNPSAWEAVIAYAQKKAGRRAKLWAVDSSQLSGGHVAEALYRHDFVFGQASGELYTISVVQKYTSEAEVAVLEVLNQMPNAKAVPLLVGAGLERLSDEVRHFIVMPFYSGDVLTFADAVPPRIVKTLARIHAHFASRPEQFESVSDLYRVDTAFFQRTVTNALDSVDQLRLRQPELLSETLYNDFKRVVRQSTFDEVLQSLPATLVHGDVHPGNIIGQPNGRSILIDWGNARIAPAMLDIANVVEIDSADWHLYLANWKTASNLTLDLTMWRKNYHWASAMVNLQYLPFATNHLPNKVAGMMGRIVQAEERLMTS